MGEFIHFIAKVLELLSLVYLAGVAFAAGWRTTEGLFPKRPLMITGVMRHKE